MRGLLAIFFAAAAVLLKVLSWLTLFPSRWLANAAEWCSSRSISLSAAPNGE